MRRLALSLLVASIVLSFGGAGCNHGASDDGVKPENRQALTDINAAAKAADGNFDKLSEADKQRALQMANGNEASARSLVKMMAHPPNEANRNRIPGGAGAPGK